MLLPKREGGQNKVARRDAQKLRTLTGMCGAPALNWADIKTIRRSGQAQLFPLVGQRQGYVDMHDIPEADKATSAAAAYVDWGSRKFSTWTTSLSTVVVCVFRNA